MSSWVESFKISVSGVRVAARRREANSAQKRLAWMPEVTNYIFSLFESNPKESFKFNF
jgi:hypothetical protein